VIVRRRIDSKLLSVECGAALEPAAKDVLDSFEDLARSGTQLRDGARLRFGFSLLTLRAEDRELRVCEPDFSGDALHSLRPTLDTTLSIIAGQVRWLGRTGERGADVFFDQQAVFAADAWSAPEIFALRTASVSEEDSGWSIAPVPAEGEEIDKSRLSAIPIYRLVEDHPGLVSIMAFPEGYLVRLRGDEVVEISDPTGRVCWEADHR
jgi:hypothetical protein